VCHACLSSVPDLTKTYRIVDNDPGIAGSFKALFRPRYKDILAIDRLYFSLEVGMAFLFPCLLVS